MERRKDDSDQALSWALSALFSKYDMVFHWDESGRPVSSFKGAPGADVSIVDRLLIVLSPTVDGIGGVMGDKAGAENEDNEGL
jgi:hypothetical protein